MDCYFKTYYEGGLVIDLGCGWWSGVNANVLLDMAKATVNGNMKTCANVYADFHYLPFKDGTFSYVYSRQSIEHAKYQDVAIKEWCRILKVGGIFQIEWPGWLEKRDPQNFYEKFEVIEDILNRKDMKTYLNMGLDPNWISKGPTNKLFFDTHWNICDLDEMLTRLPKCLTVLEAHPEGDCVIVARKNAE